MAVRIFYLIILVLAAFVLPFWLFVILVLVGVFRFADFYDALLPIFVFEVLHRQSFYATAGALLFVYAAGLIKSRLLLRR